MKRIVIALLAVFAVLSFSSCVRDEEPIFKESASARLQNALQNAQTILVGAENGWKMYYYPSSDQQIGGYLYVLKFTQNEVEVWSDIFLSNESTKSLYKMTTDDGPVLSIDTNNYFFHFFATPSGNSSNLYGVSGRYQAYHGDFEFLIMSATPEKVVLKGKRSNNLIVMYPLAADENPVDVKNAATDFANSLYVSTFEGTIGSNEAKVFLDLVNRQASVELVDFKSEKKDEPASGKVAYICTGDGMLFYEPLKVGTDTLKGFQWNAEERLLTALPDDKTQVLLHGRLPDGWHAYEDFLGTWTLSYRDGARTMADIEIKQYSKDSFIISGLSKQFDVLATYDLSIGQIEIQSQYVGVQDSYRVMMAAWDSNAGKVNYTVAGMQGMLNDEMNTITWHDNGKWEGYNVESFILYYFNSSGSRVGATSSPWFWKGLSSNQLWGWTTFTRQ